MIYKSCQIESTIKQKPHNILIEIVLCYEKKNVNFNF